jgi:hypothetical protein
MLIIPSIKGVMAVDRNMLYCTVIGEVPLLLKVKYNRIEAQLWACNAFNGAEE